MRSISAAENGLESLRDAFLLRMAGESVHFAAAQAALAQADKDPAPIYQALYDRAHRLHGGALIFNFAAVGVAAAALEDAALHASNAPFGDIHAPVRHALRCLVELMGRARKSD